MKGIVFIYILLLIFFVQCIRHNSGIKNNSQNSETVNSDSLKTVINFVLSPNEIINEILADNKSFNTDIVNPKGNISKYINSNSQATNLGIYISDFAYLNLSGYRTNALDYFKIISELAQKINIYGCFDEAIFNRIQNNLADRDSLIGISEEMYYNMTDILENSKRPKVYILISSGALIESFYLAIMNISVNSDSEKIKKKLFEQEKLLKNTNIFISTIKGDQDIKVVYDQIQSLISIMDKAERKSVKKSIVHNKNNHLEIKGGEEIKISDTLFEEFKSKVETIRNDMVNVSNK